MKRFISSIILFHICTVLFGQTPVLFDISTNTTWDVAGSPYQISNSITIQPGISLDIEPGVEVQLVPGGYLIVEGTLTANGTSNDSILFRSSLGGTAPNSFGGIQCRSGGEAYLSFVDGQGAESFLLNNTSGPFLLEMSRSRVLSSGYILNFGAADSSQVYIDSSYFENTAFRMELADTLDIRLSTFNNVSGGTVPEMWLAGIPRAQLYACNWTNGGGLYVENSPRTNVQFCNFDAADLRSFQAPGLSSDWIQVNSNFTGSTINVNGALVLGSIMVQCNLSASNSQLLDNYIDWTSGNNGGYFQGGNFYNTSLIYNTFIGDGQSISEGVRITGNVDTVLIESNQILDFGMGLNMATSNAGLVFTYDNLFCNDSLNVVSYGMNFLELSDNCWCTEDTAIIATTIDVQFGGYNIWPLDSGCIQDLVYPGDVNKDLVANLQDLLSLGLVFGNTGHVRNAPSLNWIGQYARDWWPPVPNGPNGKHADTDGNGVVNLDDTLAINLNFGLTYTSSKTTQSGVPLFFTGFPENLEAGDTLEVGVHLGTMDSMANNIYGLVFQLAYDTSLIVPGSFRASVDSSWLGTKNVDMLSMYQDQFDDGIFEMALVRNDQMPISGFGQIATLVVVLEDDIAKQAPVLDLVFEFAQMIDHEGLEVPVGPESASAEIGTTGLVADLAKWVKVYPQPTNDQLVITADGANLQSLMLLDFQARELPLPKFLNSESRIETSLQHLPPGTYLLRIQTDQGMLMKKVIRMP